MRRRPLTRRNESPAAATLPGFRLFILPCAARKKAPQGTANTLRGEGEKEKGGRKESEKGKLCRLNDIWRNLS